MKKFYLIILSLLICISLFSLYSIYPFKDKIDLTDQVMLVNGQKPIMGTWAEMGPSLEIEVLKKSDFQKLITKDYKVYWIDGNLERKLVHRGNEVFFIQFSPSQDRLSFYYYPEGHSLGDIVLLIFDPDTGLFKEVYRNSHRTSNYSWRDNSTLAVNYSCGTACMLEYIINSKSGEIIKKNQLY